MFKELFTKECFEYGTTALPYRFHLPENMQEGKKYPLILFLHGAGERGSDNEAQLRHGVGTALEDPDSPWHDSYVIAPQCPLDKMWVDTLWENGAYYIHRADGDLPETPYLAAAIELCRRIMKEYPVDPGRVIVSGISMGGFGSWDTLARHSDMFAGAFICCGSGDPACADSLKDKIIYTYHGDVDETVPVSGTRSVVDAIRAAGGTKITYREYAGMGHWTWDRAYAEYDDMKALFAAL